MSDPIRPEDIKPGKVDICDGCHKSFYVSELVCVEGMEIPGMPGLREMIAYCPDCARFRVREVRRG